MIFSLLLQLDEGEAKQVTCHAPAQWASERLARPCRASPWCNHRLNAPRVTVACETWPDARYGGITGMPLACDKNFRAWEKG